MKSEAVVQEELRLVAARMGTPLWRNNNGACKDETGRMIRFGLGNDSAKLNSVWKSPDLIGITPITIRQCHVGRVLGLFTGVEVKREGWTPSPTNSRENAQGACLTDIAKLGGLAMFCDSAEYYERTIKTITGVS